jgi:ABC-type sulfate transport system permease component
MEAEVIRWGLGIFGALFTLGASVWANSVINHLKSIDSKLENAAKFQGKTEAVLEILLQERKDAA